MSSSPLLTGEIAKVKEARGITGGTICTLWPVSYTHLDVYKRQVLLEVSFPPQEESSSKATKGVNLNKLYVFMTQSFYFYTC